MGVQVVCMNGGMIRLSSKKTSAVFQAAWLSDLLPAAEGEGRRKRGMAGRNTGARVCVRVCMYVLDCISMYEVRKWKGAYC